MPELPEVELVVRGLHQLVVGRKIIGARVLWPGYIEGINKPKQIGSILSGEKFVSAERRGKFILIRLEHHAMLNHLRMTGKILKLEGGGIPPHTHVVFELDDGSRLVFSDVRKFGRLQVFPIDQVVEKVEALNLGIEPLGDDFTSVNLALLFSARSRSIKSMLLDQTIMVGIGNIYACEILFAARVEPFRPAGALERKEIARIVRSTRRILQDGEPGGMQDRFRVYGRAGERCLRCGGTVSREVQVGRSTFWCRSCQL
jgi:formamidopyrimidine-DNA glycosylase